MGTEEAVTLANRAGWSKTHGIDIDPTQMWRDLALTIDSLSKADVGLGNVDNTSDAAKPLSVATQTALATKADATATGVTKLLKEPLIEIGVEPSTGRTGVMLPGGNDLAFNLLRGGSVTATLNGASYPRAFDPAPLFSPDWLAAQFTGLAASDVLTIEAVYAPGIQARWGPTVGISMYEASPNRAKNIAIEAMVGGAWISVGSVTNEATGRVYMKAAAVAGETITRLRFTLTNFSGSNCFINQLVSLDFRSTGLGGTFLPRSGGELFGTSAAPPKLTATGADGLTDLLLEGRDLRWNGFPAGLKVSPPSSATAAGKPGQWATDAAAGLVFFYTGNGTTHSWGWVKLSTTWPPT